MSRLQPVAGTEIVDGIRLGHLWNEYEVLKKFVQHERPNWFIEIGVHEGGLSYLLIPEIKSNYLGVEINCEIVTNTAQIIYWKYAGRAELWCGNCFDPELWDKIAYLPNKLIYCDGGDKVTELLYFKKACNIGDIIMAHDYHDGIRKIKGMKEVYPEVLPQDVEHFDKTFERLPEEIFKETRIIGWRKNG